jgi:hypothetical protein
VFHGDTDPPTLTDVVVKFREGLLPLERFQAE